MLTKKARSKAKPRTTSRPQSPVVTRHVSHLQRLLLFVRAGGRCEFDGCNDYLLEDGLTLTEGNFSQVAHIVGFREEGPRGKDGKRPRNINQIENLMLLCAKHHKLIDDHPQDYTRLGLEKYKKSHEDRVRHVTSLGANRKTAVLVFKAPIGGHTVAVPFDRVVEATAPRYPMSRDPLTIDLTQMPTTTRKHLQTACDAIVPRVTPFFSPEGEAMKAGHVSVFAIGPIPLLIFLGRQLTSKVPIDVYQRHRDTESWTWKTDGPSVTYVVSDMKAGAKDKVALVLSLSGKIQVDTLPQEVRDSYTIYELSLGTGTPNPTFLRTPADLEGFRLAYQELLGRVLQQHGALQTVDLFPAVPAPVAVLCGRELLPKVHPKLRIFDYDKDAGGFTLTLIV